MRCKKVPLNGELAEKVYFAFYNSLSGNRRRRKKLTGALLGKIVLIQYTYNPIIISRTHLRILNKVRANLKKNFGMSIKLIDRSSL